MSTSVDRNEPPNIPAEDSNVRQRTPPSPPTRTVPSKTNVSTACSGCRRRKVKCSGQYPCTQCLKRDTVAECHIDSTTDLRRKRVSDLRIAELKHDRALLDDLLEAIRICDGSQLEALTAMIRAQPSKQEVRSYIRSTFQLARPQPDSRSPSLSDGSSTTSTKAKSIRELLNPFMTDTQG